jgi:hypothetical protein
MSTLITAGTLRPTRTETHTLQAGSVGLVEVTVADRDRTRPFLLLHGGGGVMTMAGFADLLAERAHSAAEKPKLAALTPHRGSTGSLCATG